MARSECIVWARSLAQARPIDGNENNMQLPDNLAEATADVLDQLRCRTPQRHDGVEHHELPPLLPKALWANLGELLKSYEEYSYVLPRDKWISLRLDGCSWGTLLDRLRKSNVLRSGYSDGIAEAMMATCRAVMCEFGATLGYTHSDEMTVLVAPTIEPRIHKGSVQSWVSIAASVASGEFNRRIASMAAQNNATLDELIVAHFDCRAGVFPTATEASALILWRASDCNVNSASDAIKFSPAPTKVRAFNTIQKLCYLQERGLLPLRRHQGYGSLFREVLGSITNRTMALVNSGDGGGPLHVLNLARLHPLLMETDDSNAGLDGSPQPQTLHTWPYDPPQCL